MCRVRTDRHVRTGIALLLAGICSACALPRALPETGTLTVPEGTMLVVGRIVLDPPFAPEYEQHTHWTVLNDGAIVNRVMLATDVMPREIEYGRLRGEDWRSFIDTLWGEYFFAVVPRSERYLNGVVTPLDVRNQEYYWFPGGMVLRPPATGDIAYAGTLVYRRNDFNEIVGIDVVDEKSAAMAAIRQRFGRAPEQVPTVLWRRQLPWEVGD